MLDGGYSWRLFFYVEFAFGMALLIFAFFVVEETTYHRKAPQTPLSTSPTASKTPSAKDEALPVIPPRRTFLQSLKPWGTWEKDSPFFSMMARSFTYFLVPHVFWVVTTYGIYIGLGALTFNLTFPILITAPPYSWPPVSAGLITISTVIGYGLAVPFTQSSDLLAARLTRRNGGIREAEMRLGVMLPAMLIAPAGLIVYGMTAQRTLHWVGYFAGVAMTQWGSYFYFTFTLAYAIDSYNANISEMLIAMNLGKQAISFGMGVNLLEWIMEHGYAVMISGVFVGLLLANNLSLILFMFFGKRVRGFMQTTFLARMHKDSIREVATH